MSTTPSASSHSMSCCAAPAVLRAIAKSQSMKSLILSIMDYIISYHNNLYATYRSHSPYISAVYQLSELSATRAMCVSLYDCIITNCILINFCSIGHRYSVQ